MRKDILLAMLAASTAGSAYANVDYTSEDKNWSISGTVNDQAWINGGVITVPNLAGGEVTRTFTDLLEGKYKITWSNGKNVKVTYNGTPITNGEEFSFGGGTLTVVAGPDDKGVDDGGYSFENLTLTLVFNLAAEQAALDIVPDVDKGYIFSTPSTLVQTSTLTSIKNLRDALTKEKAAIDKNITTYNSDLTTFCKKDDTKIATYKEWLTKKSEFQNRRTSLADDVKTYNTHVQEADYNAEAYDYANTASLAISKKGGLAEILAAAQKIYDNGKEYVKDPYNGLLLGLSNANKAIDALKVAIATLNANDGTDPQKNIDACAAKLTDATTRVNDALTLAQALQHKQDNYDEIYDVTEPAEGELANAALNAAVADAQKKLFGLDKIFQDVANKRISDIVAQAMEEINTVMPDVDSATDVNYNKALQIIADTKVAIDNEVAAAIASQTAGPLAQLNAAQALLDKFDANKVPPMNRAGLQTRYDSLTKVYSEVLKVTKAEMVANDGTITPATQAKVDALVNDVTAFNDDYQVNLNIYNIYTNNINTLQSKLNKLNNAKAGYEKIESGIEVLNDHIVTVKLNGAFTPTVTFIGELQARNEKTWNNWKSGVFGPVTEGDWNTIDEATASYMTSVSAILDEFISADNYQAAANDINNKIDAITYLGTVKNFKNPYKVQTATFTAISKLLKDLHDEVEKAADNISGQDLLTKVKNIATTDNSAGIASTLNTKLYDAVYNITNANVKVCNDRYTALIAQADQLVADGANQAANVKTALTPYAAPGLTMPGLATPSLDFLESKKTVEAQIKVYTDAVDNTIGKKINTAVANYEKYSAYVFACQANYDNYNKLLKDIKDTAKSLADFKESTEVKSLGAATLYQIWIQEKVSKGNSTAAGSLRTTLKNQYNSFKVTVTVNSTTGVQTVTVAGGAIAGVDGYSTIEGGVIDYTNSKKTLQESIDANENWYSQLVAKSQEVNAFVLNVFATVDADTQGSDLTSLYDAVQDELNNLYDVNEDMYKDYTNGLNNESYTKWDTALEGIRTRTNQILTGLTNSIQAYNLNEFIPAWEKNYYFPTKNYYTEAMQIYEKYKSVTYADFLNYTYNGKTVTEYLKQAHDALFGKLQLIVDQNTAVNGKIQALNVKIQEDGSIGQAATQADIQENINTVLAIKAQLEADITAMKTALQGAAEAFYADKSADIKNNQIEARKTQLKYDLGYSSTVITEVDNAFGPAEAYLATAAQLYGLCMGTVYPYPTPSPLALDMDNIGEQFTLAESYALEAANGLAVKVWNNFMGSVNVPTSRRGTAAGYIEKFDSMNFGTETAEYANFKYWQNKFNDLDAQASATPANLYDNLKVWEANINSYLVNMKSTLDAAEAVYNGNALRVEFNETGYEALNVALEDLKAYIMSLASAQDQLDTTIASLQARIDNIKYTVDNTTSASQLSADLQADGPTLADSKVYADLLNDMQAGGKNAADLVELNYLKTQFYAAKQGFNVALGKGLISASEADKHFDVIDGAIKDTDKYLTIWAVASHKWSQADYDTLLALETTLANETQTLAQLNGENPKDDAVKALNGVYASVLNNIPSAYYSEYGTGKWIEFEEPALSEFNAAISQIKQDLAAVQTAYEGVGNLVIVHEDKYTYELKKLGTAAKTAYDKYYQENIVNVNESVNEILTNELNDLQALLGDNTNKAGKYSLTKLAATYGFDVTLTYNTIQPIITAKESDVNAAYKVEHLTRSYQNDLINGWTYSYKDNKGNWIQVHIDGIVDWTADVNEVRLNILNTAARAQNQKNWDAYEAADKALNETPYTVNKAELRDELNAQYKAIEALNVNEVLVPNVTTVCQNAAESQTAAVNLVAYLEQCGDIQKTCLDIRDQAIANSYVPGDVSGEGNVTVRDAAQIIQYILKRVKLDATDRNHVAADINGNKMFDIADVQKVINIANQASDILPAPRFSNVAADCNLTVESFNSHSASSLFGIGVNSTSALTGGQLDIVLPEGSAIESIEATGRLSGLDFYTNDLGDGVTRIVFISLENEAAIADLTGAMIMVKTTGNSINVENAYFTNASAQLLSPSNGNVSGVTTLWQDVKSAGHKIYNAAGQLMNRMGQGVNIIRNSDGSTDKVYKK